MIHFDSQFILILIRSDFYSPRITIHLRIMIHLRIKIKSKKKSKVVESWFTHLRIIGWFDFASKANQSESRIKLVWALPLELVFLKFKTLESWCQTQSRHWKDIFGKLQEGGFGGGGALYCENGKIITVGEADSVAARQDFARLVEEAHFLSTKMHHSTMSVLNMENAK